MIKTIWIILLMVPVFLFSCASTQPRQDELRDAKFYNNRGIAFAEKGQYDRAISDFNKSIAINPLDAEAYNHLAWLLATAKAQSYRNGKKAVELAMNACRLSDWKNLEYIDTLAAAYARAGDFDNRVKWQEKVLESSKSVDTSAFQQRLLFYRERKPWPAD